MKFMRNSALILAIAKTRGAIAACGGDSGQTASIPGTPRSTPAAPATRNRWDSFLMDSGSLVESATPDTFFSNPKEERTRKFLSQIL